MCPLFIFDEFTKLWENCFENVKSLIRVANRKKFLDHIIAVIVLY